MPGVNRTDELLRAACGVVFYLVGSVVLVAAVFAARTNYDARPVGVIVGWVGAAMVMAFIILRLLRHLRIVREMVGQEWKRHDRKP